MRYKGRTRKGKRGERKKKPKRERKTDRKKGNKTKEEKGKKYYMYIFRDQSEEDKNAVREKLEEDGDEMGKSPSDQIGTSERIIDVSPLQ